jgi:hypothetical protein
MHHLLSRCNVSSIRLTAEQFVDASFAFLVAITAPSNELAAQFEGALIVF